MLRIQRPLQRLILLSYLLITLGGFLFATFRYHPPFIPWTLVRWSYSMMSPYQGIHPVNQYMRAEGQMANGSWQQIDLDPYYPVGFGEKTIRMHLQTFNRIGKEDLLRAKYRELALRLQELEAQRGRSYVSVRLWWDSWPRSPDGFFTLDRAPHVSSELITTIP